MKKSVVNDWKYQIGNEIFGIYFLTPELLILYGKSDIMAI